MDFIFLILGMLFLVIGANKFVSGASSLASRFNISPIIIGLSIVAFGTSAPELAVSVIAGVNNSNEIVLGNVVGSNIFNMLIVIGVSCLFTTLVVSKELLRRDWLISILGCILLFILIVFDNVISRFDGCVLIVCFIGILYLQVRSAFKNKEIVDLDIIPQSLFKMIFNIIFGISLIIIGGNLCVDGAVNIAVMFNVSQTIIGLTIVAVGTSLPEFVTSVIATKRGENDIAIGNVIGSNIFNLFFILGVSSIINPISIEFSGIIDLIILFFFTVFIFILAYKNKIKYYIGFLLIISYIFYTIFIIIR